MSEHPPHLRLLQSPSTHPVPIEDPTAGRGPVALLHEWRAAKIARSKSMHPTNLVRAASLPALQPVR